MESETPDMYKLLFICGFPGGGTDLVKTILNSHPDVYINGEMPFLKNVIRYGYGENTKFSNISEIAKFQKVLHKFDTWGNIENLDHNFSESIEGGKELSLEEVLRICFSEYDTAVWGNKTPQNTENIDLLAKIFPTARFLIVVRDVRDICLSWQSKWGKDIMWCAAKWSKRMREGWNATRNLPAERSIIIKFEDVLSFTELCCKKICDFLEIPFSSRMLVHHIYTDEYIDGKINYGKKIIRENKNKWESELSLQEVERIEQIANDTMKILGYKVMVASGPRSLSSFELLRALLNDTISLFSVGNRARRKNTLTQRIQGVLYEFRKQINK
jgi:protein-tyrosine sulfotransferase